MAYIPEPPILRSDYSPFPPPIYPIFDLGADFRIARIQEEERRKAAAEAAEKKAKQEAKRTAEAKEKVMNLSEEEKETLKQRYGSSPRIRCLATPSGLTDEEAHFTRLLRIQEQERCMAAKNAEEEQKAFEAEVQRRVELELHEGRVRAEVERRLNAAMKERLAQEEKSSKSAILFEELKGLF